MKKIDKSHKRWLKNHAKKQHKIALRSKEKKKAWRRFLQKTNGRNEKVTYRKPRWNANYLQGYAKRFPGYKLIEAPYQFSMTNNTENSLSFIDKIERCLNANKKVFVVLDRVTEIANGAIVVLLSIMLKFQAKGILFNGSYPRDSMARSILINSGFFDILYKPQAPTGDEYSIEKKNIYTYANKIVDSELADNLRSVASKHIWGTDFRSNGLQRVFLELMQNTNNHASLINQKEHHWYTTVCYDKKRNVSSFAFIDYGTGIIENIKTDERGKFFNGLRKIEELFHPKDNSEMLKLLLSGEVHKASGKSYRGKGLPGIFNALKSNKISNLVIITNDAYADCTNADYHTIKSTFSGTFVYWELNENNQKLPPYNDHFNSSRL